MSYASKRTTNNIAENVGLLMGLREYQRQGWTPLHVVGGQQHDPTTAKDAASPWPILPEPETSGPANSGGVASPRKSLQQDG
ncbi:hypothetical protein PC129_g16431 [Phytophthora cactorum]|uniref:Uncharacterized protein n=1 Tax=Phytophthora cactorum TaxID=29920 RepID=A0A329RGN8_9STRA|nr:hypothetical protein GQ600_26559 [Phytophthora cactorum]KAG2788864.1 hypothetical protein Pcac1_g1842 [Phytophthora cactorum]KAG2796192.1 hypothetical protein PC111_g21834 [Phytophthora cactorum]KAG2887830.1 hypothetical protein PC114_g18650 [Phytophthora cactorum]KAG2915140.1 hypothetical protein PC117_g18100 [Phytophthora cactorum]